MGDKQTLFVKKSNGFISFYTGFGLDDIRDIYDISENFPVVIKTYTHSTKNRIKICTNDTDPDYNGGAVIIIKVDDFYKNSETKEKFLSISEIRTYLLELFKKQ